MKFNKAIYKEFNVMKKHKEKLESIVILKVTTLEESRICNQLLTKLVNNESKYNYNIKDDYVINEWFENLYYKENNAIFVAKENNIIIGYIYVKVISSDNGPTKSNEALIDGLYVEEEFRKRGIATKLIQKAKKWAENIGCKYVLINVLEGNINAINLYNKEGFKDFEKTLKMQL